MRAATAASYCPNRAGELPKQNMTKYMTNDKYRVTKVLGDTDYMLTSK